MFLAKNKSKLNFEGSLQVNTISVIAQRIKYCFMQNIILTNEPNFETDLVCS